MLLSYQYGMLYVQARQAMVYDLVEEFMQPVVDRMVMTFLTKYLATPDDFSVTR